MIQDRIERVNEAMFRVKGHCMCASIIDDGRRFVVTYPAGDFATDGARCDYSINGKAWALGKLLEIMERHWVESYLS